MPIALVTPFYGTPTVCEPANALGVALTAGGAEAWSVAYTAVTGALAADSVLVSVDLDTPAVAIEPTRWEISYGAGHDVVAEGIIGFDTAVGTYPSIDLNGVGGLIPAGSILEMRIRSATGGTTCLAHICTRPAL